MPVKKAKAGSKKASKTTSKKAAAKKKTTAKTAKKATAAKKASKKAAPKKSPAKKAPAKKASSKKPAAKTAAKKTAKKTKPTSPAKKPTAVKKKSAAKKAPAASAKTAKSAKTTAKKASPKKPSTVKKSTAKKASAAAPKKKAPAAKQAKTTAKPVAQKRAATKKASKKESKPIVSVASRRSESTPAFKPYVVERSEDYMNEDQKNHFRAILNNWRNELMSEVDRTVMHMKDEASNFPDPADRASQEEEFSLELRTRDRERKLIRKIDSTLELIEQDEYGYCEACGIEIGIQRLEARPTASLCIDCKTLDEIKERQEHG